MMRSLWSAVSGLNTHQVEMDVIGNNISNVNTTSYKAQATGFQDLLYQTIKSGGPASNTMGSRNITQVGLGTKVGSIYNNITKQGSAQVTYNPFDLMISGDSFFVITPDNTSGLRNYSRDGAFTIDAEGRLVTQNNGFYVMGVMGGGDVTRNSNLTRLDLITNATKTIAGTPTSEAFFKGNIDSGDKTLEDGIVLRLEAYGNDGKTYTIKFNITDAGDDDDATFRMEVDGVQDSDHKTVRMDTPVFHDLTYDKHTGEIKSIDGYENAEGFILQLDGDAAVVGPIHINMENSSNYASSMPGHASTLNVYKGDVNGLNKGYANGEMTGLSVTDNGSIYARYSNGQDVKLAQIAVAEFSNAMGLELVGNNLYAASLNSGDPMIMDITTDGGYMSTGVLESSNVDLSKEFTDMITTQRGFQANSRVITTSDEMLQTIKSLKR